METKFTKGKWAIFGDWGICKNGWETDLIATFEPRGVGQKEGFANAHLIAAAPEMYNLLERLTSHDNCKKDIIHLLGEADNLLAKARGEHE